MRFIEFAQEVAEKAKKERMEAEETGEKVKQLRLKWKSGEIMFDEYNLELDKMGF